MFRRITDNNVFLLLPVLVLILTALFMCDQAPVRPLPEPVDVEERGLLELEQQQQQQIRQQGKARMGSRASSYHSLEEPEEDQVQDPGEGPSSAGHNA